MAHEHLSMTFDVAYVKPRTEEAHKTNFPISMENLGWIRYHPYSHLSNLHFNDAEVEPAIFSEMESYKAVGGGSIVECTTHGISRKVDFLRQVSQTTGVNVIAGTGYYVAASHKSTIFSEPVEKLVDVMRSEILDGCVEAPDIRCGLIGEMGTSWPLHGINKLEFILTHLKTVLYFQILKSEFSKLPRLSKRKLIVPCRFILAEMKSHQKERCAALWKRAEKRIA